MSNVKAEARDELKRANEDRFANNGDHHVADRKLFVENCGWLLSQTREGVVGAYLDDCEIVHIKLKDGDEVLVNVRLDSYTSIVWDMTKALLYGG